MATLPYVEISGEDFERLYISRAAYDTLAAELAEAREENKVMVCAFCEKSYEKSDKGAWELGNHVVECEKHPLHQALADNAELVTMTKKAQAERDQAKAELAALREQMRWIPCSERMPEFIKLMAGAVFSETVLAWDGSEYYPAVYVSTINHPNCWQTREGMIPTDAVTHWKPLPPGPEVANE